MSNECKDSLDVMKERSSSSSTCASCGKPRSDDGLSDVPRDSQMTSAGSDMSGCNGDANSVFNVQPDDVFPDPVPRPRGMSLDLTRNVKRQKRKPLQKQMTLDSVVTSPTNRDDPKNASSWSVWSGCSSSQPAISPRENIASMRRKQLAHTRCNNAGMNEDATSEKYLTPSQRKDQIIRDLRQSLKESNDRMKERELEIQNLYAKRDTDVANLLTNKDTELHSLRDQNADLQQMNQELTEEREKLSKERDEIRKNIQMYEEALEKREEHHREMYLMMYEKGQKSADFVRQDTLEEVAVNNPESVSLTELLQKLNNTQSQLSQLQSCTREMTYKDATLLSPSTDNEATLRCMKDALFHYLTVSDQKEKRQHLSIMISMASFTAPQRRKIDKAMSKNKSKT